MARHAKIKAIKSIPLNRLLVVWQKKERERENCNIFIRMQIYSKNVMQKLEYRAMKGVSRWRWTGFYFAFENTSFVSSAFKAN